MNKIKVYLDSGATDKKFIKKYCYICDFYQYPCDSAHRTKSSSINLAYPSEVQWRDANISWAEDSYTWGDCKGSILLSEIKNIIGKNNRRDALHLDSAYKTNCSIFLTSDKKDIYSNKKILEPLLKIKIFHINQDINEFELHLKATLDGPLIYHKFNKQILDTETSSR
ncbi:hypothetical protein L6269_03845 [Candidatus Dependentiae bacterium]|nr:hypothetical protein [Candidatus Dependentiae bacterium]MCG2756591.1 hypothetical protein [Candidatus Dependentiae bacterium]